MKHETLAVLVFCAAVFGGLAFLFVSLTDGINEPLATGAGVQIDDADGDAPPAGPIVDENAPIVLGSPSITTNAARDEIAVDFFECIPGGGSLDFSTASVSFEVKGLRGNDCVVEYSAGGDKVTCQVPSDVGARRFSIENNVPAIGAIEGYCEAG